MEVNMTLPLLCTVIRHVDKQEAYDTAIAENPDNAGKKSSGERGRRATATFHKHWASHRLLRISFTDNPTAELRNAIEHVIWQWDQYVNLLIEFSPVNDGDIRISTNTSRNASSIGTDALLFRTMSKPTMYIAVKPADEGFEAMVLHEFGHALGLLHEHLHPESKIPWNKEKVYEDYGRALNVSRDEIHQNFFATYPPASVRRTPYDTTSIMHYMVQKEFTDGEFEIVQNTTLSELDKELISSMYPYEPN
jgi:hypothetical protein